MSLRSQAAIDNQNILDNQTSVTLIEPDTTEHDVNGKVNRVDMQVDPDTGVQFYEPKTSVDISISSLPAGFANTWTVQTTDVMGATITGHIAEARYDRTLGYVTLILEAYE